MKEKIQAYIEEMTTMQKFILFLHLFLIIFLCIYLLLSLVFYFPNKQKQQEVENPKPPSVIQIIDDTTLEDTEQPTLHPNPNGTGSGAPKPQQSSQSNSVGTMKLYVLDTGNSDCSLLMLPDGINILFDVGDRDDGQAIVSALTNYGVDHLSAIVIGHWDSDHFGGTIDVLSSIPTDKVYAPVVPEEFVPTTYIYQKTLKYLSENNYSVRSPNVGETIVSNNDYDVKFLNSTNSGEKWSEYDQNGYSLVVMITFGKHKYMITSDALAKNEQQIISRWGSSALDVDFMKIGHHCSKTSTSDSWLRATKPEYGVCTCAADNDYGHPHQIILNRLKNHKVTVYRSDVDGTILVTDNGKNFEITTNLPSADGSRQ